MKLLLTILGSLSVGSTPAVATIATNPIYNQNLSLTTQEAIWEPPLSMEGIQRSLERYYIQQVGGERWSGESDFNRVQEDYYRLVNGRDGTLSVTGIKPITETVDNTFEETFTNATSRDQTFQSHAYTQRFINTSTFTVQLMEQASIEIKANFWFAETKVAGLFSSTQSWTSTQTVIEIVTAPSQTIVVPAQTRGIVTYIIKSGTYDVSGILRFPVSLTQELDTCIVFNSQGAHQSSITLGEIIRHLNEAGYGSMMGLTYHDFSVISTDNPSNPSLAYINIPISYVSNGGKLDVTFTEEPLI